MNTLFDVKKTVRSLVGDDAGEWTTDSYLLPKINYAYRTQTLYLKRQSGKNLEQVVEVPDGKDANGNSTSMGRSSLAQLQQPGQPLAGLFEPLYIWWKPAGSPPNFYRECVGPVSGPLMPLLSPSPMSTVAWNWLSSQLSITPISFPYDLLVDGRFNPPPLVKDTDVLVTHPDMETAVTAATIGLVGVESGNAGYQEFGLQQVEACADDIAALLVMEKQGRTARAGSASMRRQQRGWFWA